MVFLVNFGKVVLLELNHLAFNLTVAFGDAVGEVGGGVGAGGVDEGEALGQVAIGVLKVIAHDFNIKIYTNESTPSVLYTVGPLEGILQLLPAEFAIVILVHRVYELDNLQLRRDVLLTHVQQRVLD